MNGIRCSWRYERASRAAGMGVDDRRRTPSILNYIVSSNVVARIRVKELNLLKSKGEVGYLVGWWSGLEALLLPLRSSRDQWSSRVRPKAY
jgi:hypothetical protein